jgi:hypothetical protein
MWHWAQLVISPDGRNSISPGGQSARRGCFIFCHVFHSLKVVAWHEAHVSDVGVRDKNGHLPLRAAVDDEADADDTGW